MNYYTRTYYALNYYVIYIDCGSIDYAVVTRINYQKPVECPECKNGLAMWRYGYRKRKVIDFTGKVYQLELPKYRCPKCKKVFHTLPTFLIPYKQYDQDTISKIQNGIRDGCGASYLSIYLWSQNLQLL